MATGLSRPNYINPVNLEQSTVLVRLVVNKDNNPDTDTVDTSTTHHEISLQRLAEILATSDAFPDPTP